MLNPRYRTSAARVQGMGISDLSAEVVSMKAGCPSAKRDKVRGGPTGSSDEGPKEGRSSPTSQRRSERLLGTHLVECVQGISEVVKDELLKASLRRHPSHDRLRKSQRSQPGPTLVRGAAR
jgi:hypothetical protein